MPARAEEVDHAEHEHVQFRFLCNPTRVLGNDRGWVEGLECIRMELGEPDASGRRRPVEVKGSEFVLDVDTVVMALGTSPNPIVTQTTPGLNAHRWGGLVVDETGLTSKGGVWAGGDAVTGSATGIMAMAAGKTAAEAMVKYLEEKYRV